MFMNPIQVQLFTLNPSGWWVGVGVAAGSQTRFLYGRGTISKMAPCSRRRAPLSKGVSRCERALRIAKRSSHAGVHPRGTRGPPPPPRGPEKHYIFRVSSVKLRDLHL